MMRIALPYGSGRLEAEVPDHAVVLTPRPVDGLPDERSAVLGALRNPIGSRPLVDFLSPTARVAVVTSDITRPMPNDRVLPWLLEEIAAAGVPDDHVVLVNGTGTHRPNTPEELKHMYGPEIVARYRIVNHNAFDDSSLVYLGRVPTGAEVYLNREVVAADVKIITGFIEPHFFAGFSGGAKGLFPGVAGIQSIMHFHNAEMIGHPRATWGVLEGNPLQEEARAVWELVRPDFLLNVTLNAARQITGVFAGGMPHAFEAGCRFEREVAMTPVPAPFDVVVTTNNGYPLDQNLYQAVKGMSAAAEIVRPGGTIVAVAECRDGVPDHGRFKEILKLRRTPRELLDLIYQPDFHMFDQWEAQKLATVLLKARVILVSSLDDQVVRDALLEPAPSVEVALARALADHGPQARIAVLPEGPMTIPYVARSVPV
jgi:nickel-dependent lactate racemase